MNLTFVSYDGNTDLASTSNYEIKTPANLRNQLIAVPAASLKFVDAALRKELVHSEPEAKFIEFQIDIMAMGTSSNYFVRRDVITELFDTSEHGDRLHTLICQDTATGANNKKWLMYVKPKTITPNETGFAVVLGCNGSFWRGITRVQLNGALNATATTIAFDNEDTNSGTFPAYGWGWVDEGYKTEFIRWMGKSASPAGNLTGVTRGEKFFTGQRGLAFAHADGKWIYSFQKTTETNPAHNGTFTITPTGNVHTEPIVRIQPTGARSGATDIGDLGQLYRRFVEVTNPNTTALIMGVFGWPINLANAESGNGLDTSALVNDTTVSNQIDNIAGIGAADATIDIDTAVGGGLPTSGMGYVDTEQIAWTENSGTQLTGCLRGIGGTTAATHANNAVIARSKMLANGNDLQIKVAGALVDRWLQDINTTSTEIWARLNLPKKITATLGTAIASSGAIGNIQFAVSAANYQAHQDLPTSGIVKIGSEYFTYTSKSAALDGKLLGVKRAAHGSAEASHAAGVTITHIPFEVYLEYGKYTTVSPNTPGADDRKPMFDLTSENDRWDFTSMDTALGGRAAEWSAIGISYDPPEANNPEAVRFYTANQDTIADPASELGIRIKAQKDGAIYKRTRFEGFWELGPLPVAMMDDVTITGEKYATDNAYWPTVQVRSGNSREQMTAIADYTQTAPSVDATWENWNNNSTNETFTSAKILQIYMNGEMPFSESTQYQALVEATQIIVGLTSGTFPTVAIGAENETAGGGAGTTTTINPDIVLTNQNTGKKIRWAGSLAASEIVVLDTERHKYFKLDDGSNQLANFSTPEEVRQIDLMVLPEANTILFEDQGTGNVTLDFFYFDRNN